MIYFSMPVYLLLKNQDNTCPLSGNGYYTTISKLNSKQNVTKQEQEQKQHHTQKEITKQQRLLGPYLRRNVEKMTSLSF